MDSILAFRSMADLGRDLRSGKTTSVELTREALFRLLRYGDGLGAVAHVLADRSLAAAAQADKDLKAGKDRGPLHGIPYGAKDLLAARGAPTEWGSFAHKGQRLDPEATAVRRLREAGAILVAKLSMVSLAGAGGYRYASASITGPGRTPWDKTRWSGGSSSGSGAAVGAGLVPFALGSETWGSIVVPSAFCGVSGLRPTYGRVPRTGAMALSWTLDKLGPMARSAEDCSLVLAAIAGPDVKDPTSTVGPYRHQAAARRRIHVGVLEEDWTNGDPLIEQAYQQALRDLEKAGAVLKDVKLPDLPYSVVTATIVVVEGTASFENVVRGPRLAKLNDPEQRAGLAAGLALSGADYLRAIRLRPRCQAAVASIFKDVDVVVAPSLTKTAPPIEQNLDTYFAGGGMLQAAGNCAGIPCMAVPMGFGAEGQPCSLQICGEAGDERSVIDMAGAYQSVTGWHKEQPKGFS